MAQERVLVSREVLASAIGDRWSLVDIAMAVDLLDETGGQFPRGAVKGIPLELRKAVQRERMLAAMLRAVTEMGYQEVVVKDVIERAGVSRPTFYEQFEDKEACFLAAIDAAATRMRDRIEAAASEGGPQWRGRIRAGVEELLRFVEAEPDAARALIVESRGAGPVGVLRHDDLLEHFARCIDAQVRGELTEAPSQIAADGVVGGIASVLYTRLNKGELKDLDSLLPSLMYFAVLPYAGHKAAAEEMRGGAPA